jgi:hypothetical protein
MAGVALRCPMSSVCLAEEEVATQMPTRAAHVGLFVCLFVGAGPFVSGEHVPFASVQLRLGYSTE